MKAFKVFKNKKKLAYNMISDKSFDSYVSES